MDDLIQEMIWLGTSIRRKREQELSLARSQIKDLQELRQSVSRVSADQQNASIVALKRDIEKMKAESENKLKELDKFKKEVLVERDRNAKMMQDLHEKQSEMQKVFPRARYAVNMYRDVSRIRWQSQLDDTDVKGFTCSKSGSKTFKFDTSKQSQFFITNSLWDLVDTDST